jgi:hypothetical protein
VSEHYNRTQNTYRVSDGSPVWFNDALRVWTPIAYDELLAIARTYNARTTHEALGERVQELSGVATRLAPTDWVGKVVEAVAALASVQGDPPLAALCTKADGTVGSAYGRLPRNVDDEPGENVERMAARHRLLCYQKYAEDLPADGGHLYLTEKAARTRSSAAKSPAAPRAPRAAAPKAAKAKPVAPEPVKEATCPVHFQVLPASGRCDLCDF